MIARGINQRVVNRGDDAKAAKINDLWAQKFPKDGIVYRGGAFDNDFQSFFVPNKKYRVPGYLATSLIKKIAVGFALRAREDKGRVLWKVAVDKRGITDPLYRCRHAFVLEMTHIPGEEEYLFVPYRSVYRYTLGTNAYTETRMRFTLTRSLVNLQHIHRTGDYMEQGHVPRDPGASFGRQCR